MQFGLCNDDWTSHNNPCFYGWCISDGCIHLIDWWCYPFTKYKTFLSFENRAKESHRRTLSLWLRVAESGIFLRGRSLLTGRIFEYQRTADWTGRCLFDDESQVMKTEVPMCNWPNWLACYWPVDRKFDRVNRCRWPAALPTLTGSITWNVWSEQETHGRW